MPKSKGRGMVGKRGKLKRRGAELKKSFSKRKKPATQKNNSKADTKTIKGKRGVDAMYPPEFKTLLVGEGNFSFTRALVRKWEALRAKESKHNSSEVNEEEFVGFRTIATCYDAKEELISKYPDAFDIIREIQASGVTVHAGIDATRLLDSKRIVKSLKELCEDEAEVAGDATYGFDRIIFNFPHLGCGITDTEENNKQHRRMLEQFFHSAHSVLAQDGQLHVTVKVGEPYDSWRVPKIAMDTGLFVVHSSVPFDPAQWDGYAHKRTIGATRNEAIRDNVDIASEKASARTLIFTRTDRGTERLSKVKDHSDSDSE